MTLTGKKFGKLTVLEKIGKTQHGNFMWRCICDCGNIKVTDTPSLKSGHTRSCGCLLKERSNEHKIKHGQAKTRLYNCWISIKQRCLNSKNSFYKDYGARGITICSDWLDFKNFFNWAMVNGYNNDLTIDRIDVNGNYEPNNCRWVDRKTQANNRRCSKLFVINGEAKILKEWCSIYGMAYTTAFMRLKKGWSIIDALTTPPKQMRAEKDEE